MAAQERKSALHMRPRCTRRRGQVARARMSAFFCQPAILAMQKYKAQPPWRLMIPSDAVGCKPGCTEATISSVASDGTTAVTTNTPMRTTDSVSSFTRLFSELVDGASDPAGAFILNHRDVGLLRSMDALSADDASGSVNGGATIAAHIQHERYGLSLMNRWAREGGNPFADAKWDEAGKMVDVDAPSGNTSETVCVKKPIAGYRR